MPVGIGGALRSPLAIMEDGARTELGGEDATASERGRVHDIVEGLDSNHDASASSTSTEIAWINPLWIPQSCATEA